MIARDYITQWSIAAPWPDRQQVEQDLVLSRLVLEIAGDPLLGEELAFRGGTCLHKLHLPAALRYSEDLDYVRMVEGGIGPCIDALREIAERVGLAEKSRDFAGQMAHFVCAAPAEDGGEIRVKIEINIGESKAVANREMRSYEVDSRWWSGAGEVSTFALEELMATKLRALYQRRKGRDLFDLSRVLAALEVDPEKVVQAMVRYMGADAFGFPQLRTNLRNKLEHPDFRDDLRALVVELPDAYDLTGAADLLMERLGRHLKNAPDSSEITNGAWRR